MRGFLAEATVQFIMARVGQRPRLKITVFAVVTIGELVKEARGYCVAMVVQRRPQNVSWGRRVD